CVRLRLADEVAQTVQAGPQPMVAPRPAMKRMWQQDVATGALTLQRTRKMPGSRSPYSRLGWCDTVSRAALKTLESRAS
ncbi:MAG: hypothetical protein KAI25_04050, partial [Hyphomicrobiaceae bacterium]|nr:hypothetical protein [Hyphomicrobiaceae bacterium]